MKYDRRTPLVEYDPSIHQIRRVGPNAPVAVFVGPVSFTTEGVVDISARFVWDVNGYYAALGVRHDATKMELMRAYLAKDGSSSPYLTMVLKNLLHPVLRKCYDQSEPGRVFLDPAVEAMRKKAELLANLGRPSEPREPDGPSEPSDVDSEREGVDDVTWNWGYFLWNAHLDTPRLRQWQACLCRVYAGVGHQLSIGLSRGGENAYLYHYGAYRIAFLREGVEPTDQLAQTLNTAITASH